jgi:hypothetical protein
MLLVNQGFTAIPTCLPLLLKSKGTNDANAQSSKILVNDRQHLACRLGPSLQRSQQVMQAMITPAVVAMRVCQSA